MGEEISQVAAGAVPPDGETTLNVTMPEGARNSLSRLIENVAAKPIKGHHNKVHAS